MMVRDDGTVYVDLGGRQPMEQIRDDIQRSLDHEGRLRAVELSQARTETALTSLTAEVKKVHVDMATGLQQIQTSHALSLEGLRNDLKELSKPRSPWPAVGAFAGVAIALMGFFALIYQR